MNSQAAESQTSTAGQKPRTTQAIWEHGRKDCWGAAPMAYLASLHRRTSALAAHRRRVVRSCRGTVRGGTEGQQMSSAQLQSPAGSLSKVQEPHLVVHGVPPQGRLVLLAQYCEHSQLATATRARGTPSESCGLTDTHPSPSRRTHPSTASSRNQMKLSRG